MFATPVRVKVFIIDPIASRCLAYVFGVQQQSAACRLSFAAARYTVNTEYGVMSL